VKRVVIVAGETSGDLHGAALMRAMKEACPDLAFSGIGGSGMIAEGLTALRHMREMNFMGFVEVVRHLPFIMRTMKDLETHLDDISPDLVILIDYPGFNLKMLPRIKKRGIPVMYYISPQLWAWHTSRVKLIRKYVDRMVVLFEFERSFYEKYGIEADFVGHPLVGMVKATEDRDTLRQSLNAQSQPLVGLFPGSRSQEIERILPVMVDSVRYMREKMGSVRAAIGCAPEISDDIYESYTEGSDIDLVRGRTYELMTHADVNAVTSGTATIEAGICGTPMVVVYRTSPLTFAIGRRLVKLSYIGMINIIAGRMIVPELWQDDVNPEMLGERLMRLMSDSSLRNQIKGNLRLAVQKLGGPGAVVRAAGVALDMLDCGTESSNDLGDQA